MIHNYYVVAVGSGNIIDVTGRPIEPIQRPLPQQSIATLDLDRTLVHQNFNEEKLKRLLHEHPAEVVVEETFPVEAWWLLRAIKPGVRVRDLCREYQIETLREYRHRSRQQINEARQKDAKI